MNTFSFLFVTALTLSLILRLWLSNRHIRHVAAHRAQVPEEFSEHISLAAHQKAADYTMAKSRFARIALLSETLFLLALTLGGGLSALSGFWQGILNGGLAYGVALILSVFALSSAVDLPFALWRQFVIEARFGFNRMSLGLFFSDLCKSALLGLLVGTPLIFAVLWLMETMGTYWWFHVWLLWCAFNLLVLLIYPSWIAPLFNRFSPMPAGEMRERVESLLGRCGFHSGGLFVMDGSKRSAHGNAYFTGFGKTKRIVFFDTLLARLQPAEVEAVLAHELGHFHHRHVVKRIIAMFTLSLLFLAALGLLAEAPWFYSGLGVHSPVFQANGQADMALALILFFLVVPVLTLPLTPLGSLISRRHEFEADRYAATHASAQGLVSALVKLYEDNAASLTPDPLHSLFYDSHPPAAIRIAHLQAVRP